MSKTVVFRLDSTTEIGSGHAMRCVAIAQAIKELGGSVEFAVSCEESKDFLCKLGYEATVIGGCPTEFSAGDASRLSNFCKNKRAYTLFVDTYAVTENFFNVLNKNNDNALKIAYLDDLYTFKKGVLDSPEKFPVDILINYSLYANVKSYESVYDGDTELLLGPTFAPLRNDFWSQEKRTIRENVENVLVTTGATNPNFALERLAKLAKTVFTSANIFVVVGAKSEFSDKHDGFEILPAQPSLLPLMKKCDVCVTAAGTTLYELCATGLPALAVSVVDNQLKNSLAFKKIGLGFGHAFEDSDSDIIENLEFLKSLGVREKFSELMQISISGDGAIKIAHVLLNS